MKKKFQILIFLLCNFNDNVSHNETYLIHHSNGAIRWQYHPTQCFDYTNKICRPLIFTKEPLYGFGEAIGLVPL